MCGIFGFIGNIPESTAKVCLHTLTHRGPDGWGLWSTPDITLGHRRLSILDLSDNGSQPMVFANGRYRITYNGEIYNFLEIRTELEAKGYSFRSESDTEVILAAFAEWGPASLDRFNGMWAFALWDTQERILFLSRDRFGKKPLFYAQLRNGFAFASEMKALFPLLDEIRPSKDFSWMSKNIFQYEATDKCLVEGITRFPAGHYGIFRNGALTLHRYWNTLDHLEEVPRTYEEQVERYRELFIDACRIRMRADVSVGTALSGGLDSSATICAMNYIAKQKSNTRTSKDWQHAFVATFPGTPLDESAYARKVVDYLNIPATFIKIDPELGIERMGEYLYLFEELYITSPVPMVQTYAAVREHGVVVTLDGHGADEMFAGYGRSLFEAFFDCGLNISNIMNVTNAYKGMFSTDSPQFAKTDKAPRLYFDFMAKRFAKAMLGRMIPVSRDADHPAFKQLDRFTQHLYLLTHETILPTLLRNYDRYAMSNGVEIRMPFMDHRLVTYTFSLPWSSKIRDGYTKKIVRDAVAPFMPYDIAYRKSKIGFNTPIVDWIKNQYKEYFIETVNSSEFMSSALIKPDDVKKKVERVIWGNSVTFQEGVDAWTGVAPFLWEKSVLNREYKVG